MGCWTGMDPEEYRIELVAMGASGEDAAAAVEVLRSEQEDGR